MSALAPEADILIVGINVCQVRFADVNEWYFVRRPLRHGPAFRRVKDTM